jgi:uncharacterized protein (DUF1697 family)
VEAQNKEAAKAERAKKARFDRIITVLALSNAEYREMRKNNFFAMTKNTEDNTFHFKEQELIFKEIYARLTKDKVFPRRLLILGISRIMHILRKLFGSRRSLDFTPS